MKMHLVIHPMSDFQVVVKEAWDLYSQTNGLGIRPTGAGPNKYAVAVITDRKIKGAKRWNPPRR